MRLTSADISTVLASRQLPHTYQQLYHAFYQQTIHHQEGMDGNARSNNLGEEEGDAEAADLKSEKATLGVAEEAAEDE